MMSFTDIFIRRPVLASVVSLLIILLGLNSFFRLEVRQYPEIATSTITITTAYPGASSDVVQGFLTSTIQKSVASAEGVDSISSSSTTGVSIVTVHQIMGYDTNQLLAEIVAKVSSVRNQLPASAESPVIDKKGGGGDALLYISFYSKKSSTSQITDYLTRVVQPQLATLDGVASAAVLGAQTFAMRIWLNPLKMAGLGITATDVTSALQSHNIIAAAGHVKGTLVAHSVTASTDARSVQTFKDIPVKTVNGRKITIGDIARVEMGSDTYDVSVAFNGTPAVYMAIYPTSTANALTVIDKVKKQLKSIEQTLPPGIHMSVAYDATNFIRASIEEVIKTLLEAIVIVIFIVFLFLGSFRFVAIAVIAIPLSLIGVLFLMDLMGYSINLLTLLAMILAVGMVVDDAIVVVENVNRHILEGHSPFKASILGIREITGPIISMTITLAAVFAPIGFLSGLTGSLFREFAFTLAASVIISGVVALTLSPMLCSKILKPHEEGGFEEKVDQVFDKVRTKYQNMLRSSLDTPFVTWIFAAIVMISLPFLFMSASSELAPKEDQGFVFIIAKAPLSTNFNYLESYTKQFEPIFKSIPQIDRAFLINNPGGDNTAMSGVVLKEWSERNKSASEIQHLLQEKLNGITGLQVFSVLPPSLPGVSHGLPVQFVLKSTASYQTLNALADQVLQKARKSGLFLMLDKDLNFDLPRTVMQINRDKATQLGVSMSQISATLATFLSGGEVGRFIVNGSSYKVITEVDAPYRANSAWLGRYYVRSRSGALIPLSTLVTIKHDSQPNTLNQLQQLNAVTISGIPLPGVSLGTALSFLQKTSSQVLPDNVGIDYKGASRQYIKEGSALYGVFALALFVIFLVLAAQFESFRDPLVILCSVPLAICGALIPLALGLATLNIYTEIGLVTLIGLITKHGILIVEFTNHYREQGMDARQAVETAAAVRLRAILMTTGAMVIGVLPLILANGAGAKSRFDIGLVIATGMSVGTLFTLFVLPALYLLIAPKEHKKVPELDF